MPLYKATAATRKRADRKMARDAAYEGPNDPFVPGSRLSRYFLKERTHFIRMECAMRELEQVYGISANDPSLCILPRSNRSKDAALQQTLTPHF